jgi:biopolymer transport protein ExbB
MTTTTDSLEMPMRGSRLLLGVALLLAAMACAWAAEPAPDKPPDAQPTKPPKPATVTEPGWEPPKASILGKNVWETFNAGGFLMWPILGCSLVGLAFAIERAVALRQSIVVPKELAQQVREVVDAAGAAAGLRLCEKRPSSLARVLEAGLRLAGRPREEIEAAMAEMGERELWHLNRYGKVLMVIAGVAPLLGLLGTVQGMIMAFDVVAQKGAVGDPRMLAAGIATALLTTFAGLTVAIPTYVLYHYFRDKADRMIVQIEETATHVAAVLKGASSHADPSSPGAGRGAADDAPH